jgi:hypothetical protein
MTDERRDDTERWTSEGGANPQGPATDSPALAPDPDDAGNRVAEQTEQPAQGSSVPDDEPAPQDLGESG